LLEKSFEAEDAFGIVAAADAIRDLLLLFRSTSCDPRDALGAICASLKDIIQIASDRGLVDILGMASEDQLRCDEADNADNADEFEAGEANCDEAKADEAKAPEYAVGDLVDVVDKEGTQCVARVLAVRPGMYYVHFEEWAALHNEWVSDGRVSDFDGRLYAPQTIWKCNTRPAKWEIGDIVGARDTENNWWLSRVIDVHMDPTYPFPWYKIHFEGWPARYDEWISSEMRVRPFYPRRDLLLSRVRNLELRS